MSLLLELNAQVGPVSVAASVPIGNFPDVPNDPGVPPVPRDFLNAAPTEIALMFSDLVVGYGAGLAPAWGVYRGGAPVILADTVTSFEFKREWAIADYPVERGGFESYDKVDIPFDARVRFAAGGSEGNRQALLDSIAAIAGDLNLYDVVTPETVYSSVNVQHFDYRRTARNGLGLIEVDVWLLEVRQTASAGGGAAQDPSGATDSNGGNVQPSQDAAPTQGSVSAFDGGGSPVPFLQGPGAGPSVPIVQQNFGTFTNGAPSWLPVQ